MTIKKRLFCSNILMIAVPAAIAALIGLVCLGLLWFILHGGGGMHLEDGEDFSRLGRSVTRQLQGCLADDPDTWTGRIRGLESMTESGALRIVVVRDDVPAYAAGEERPSDSRLAQAADGVGEAEVLVSAAGGVKLENAAAYAAAGADFLVTTWPYFGRPFDIKMKISAAAAAGS